MKRLSWFAMSFLCVAVSAYAAAVYGFLPLGKLLHPEMRATFVTHAAAIYTHVFAAMFALALGPWQFSARLRARKPRLHRIMGRLYLGIGVAVGGAAGLYMAVVAFGGVLAKTGFALLALAWLHTGWRAYAAIRAGDVASHRAWMVRNFSLTLAAVTLRIYLPFPMAMGIAFEAAYPVIAWLCWVPNLAIAQLWLQRSAHRATTRHVPASAAPAQKVAAGPT